MTESILIAIVMVLVTTAIIVISFIVIKLMGDVKLIFESINTVQNATLTIQRQLLEARVNILELQSKIEKGTDENGIERNSGINE